MGVKSQLGDQLQVYANMEQAPATVVEDWPVIRQLFAAAAVLLIFDEEHEGDPQGKSN
jgi:hypothetical protein